MAEGSGNALVFRNLFYRNVIRDSGSRGTGMDKRRSYKAGVSMRQDISSPRVRTL